VRASARRLPRRALRAGLHDAARAARRDHPLRAVHGPAREHGHARAVRALPHCRRARRGRRGGGGGAGPEHRLLPQQGEEHRRDGARARGRPRRRGAARDGRAHPTPGRGAQDRERDPRQRLRDRRGRGGGHPRGPPRAAARPHPRDRPREGGAGARPALPARALDAPLAPAHRPRPRDLRGADAEVQRVRAGGRLPEGRGHSLRV
ncbi:MAG: Endonuclease III, partial [uncultured Gemmatimonadaceae bacterium]